MSTADLDGRAAAGTPQVQVLDVLTQDVLCAVGVLVDTASAQPIAPFYAPSPVAPAPEFPRPPAGAADPGAEPVLQAVVVSAVDGLPRAAHHIVRDPHAPLGWRVRELDLGKGIEPVQVAVAHRPLRCVVLDAGGALHISAFDPATGGFGPARRLPTEGGVRWEELRTDGGDLVYARGGGARYCLIGRGAARECEFPYAPRDSALTAVELTGDWAACAAGVAPAEEYPVRVEWRAGDGAPGGRARLAAEHGKRVRQLVALYPHGAGARVLVLNRDGSFSHAHVDGGAPRDGQLAPAPVPSLPAGAELAAVVAHRVHEERAGVAHEARDVYALDTEQRLWVIRESRTAPGRWLPPVPIDQEVGLLALAGGRHGARETALFSCHRDGSHLRLALHEARTQRWRRIEVRRPASAGESFTADFHHVELSVFQPTGAPLALHEVTLASAPHAGPCEVYWRRPGATGTEPTVHTLGATPRPFRTDHAGLLRFQVRATALARPELVISDREGTFTARIRPGTKTLAYLAGEGTVRESDPRGTLPVFDAEGTVLADLAPGAAPDRLARTAATIRALARRALDAAGPAEPGNAECPLEEGCAEPGAVTAPLAGDLWFGVEQTVVDVGGWTSDGAGWTATGLTCRGWPVAPGVRLPVRGTEDGARAVGACFASLGVAPRRAIGWLSAVIDWQAVWEAKSALHRAMALSCRLVGPEGLTRVERAADAWLGACERDLDRLVDTLARGLLKDKTCQAGIAAAGPHPVVFEALNDPLAGWLEEKLQQLGPLPFPAVHLDPALVGAFAADFARVRERVLGELRGLWGAVGGLLATPEQVYAQDLSRVVVEGKEHLRALIGCLREVVHSLLEVLYAAVGAVVRALNTPLQGARVTPLWQLAARAAGAAADDGDDTPTVGGLLALMAAFPATVAYKVTVADARASLFPGGTWPFHGHGGWSTEPERDLALGVLTSMCGCYQAFALAGIDLWAVREPDQPLLRHFHGGVLVSSLAVLGAGFGDWTLATVPAERLPHQVLGEVVVGIGSLIGLLGGGSPEEAVLADAAPVITTLVALCALPCVAHAWESGQLPTPSQEWAAALGPLSPLFAFLGLPEFAATPGVPEAHAMIDLGAHVGAAIAQFVDALEA